MLRKMLEDIFGTNPSIEMLEEARDAIDEWIVELKDDKK